MVFSRVSIRSLLGYFGRGASAGAPRERNGASGALRRSSGRGERESNHGARAPRSERERGGGPPRLNSDWRATVRARLLVCAGVLGLWTAGIEARLVYLQVIAHADLMSRADRQQNRTLYPPAKRGEIFDRKGGLMAYSVDADTIAAVPNDIDDPEAVAAQVCGALDGCTAERRQTIAKSLGRRQSFAYIARQVTPEEARRVRALGLPGITLLKESRRYYPNSELAAHVVGYVGLDNVGLGGIESPYESTNRDPPSKSSPPPRRSSSTSSRPRPWSRPARASSPSRAGSPSTTRTTTG